MYNGKILQNMKMWIFFLIQPKFKKKTITLFFLYSIRQLLQLYVNAGIFFSFFASNSYAKS